MEKKKTKVVDIFIFLEIFLMVLCITLSKEVTNLDELWHYNIARQMSLGLIPYKDISLITTPLFPAIASIFLKGRFEQLIVYRIFCSILVAVTFLLAYKTLEKTTKNIPVSIGFVNIVLFLFRRNLLMEYNMLEVFLMLSIILFELNSTNKHCNNSFFNENIAIGLIAGLAFLTKQTIGAFIIIGVLFFKIFQIIKLLIKNNKKMQIIEKNSSTRTEELNLQNTKKQLIRELFIRVIGATIPLIIFALYLLITNSFYDFISYCFLGIKTFSNKISYSSLLHSDETTIKILSHIVPLVLSEPVFLLILKYKAKYDNNKNASNDKVKESNSTKKNIAILFYHAIPMLLIEYPIADPEHFFKANFILIINLFVDIYCIVKFILSLIKIKKVISQTLISVFCSITVYISVFATGEFLLTYIKEDKSNMLNHYKFLPVPDYIIDQTNDVKKLIKENIGKEVYILDSNAVALDIPLDRYFKNYDMFNNGNFGKDSTKGIIENIKNSKNCIYIIRSKDIDLNWQTPKDVIEYIRSNLKKSRKYGDV